MSRDKLDLNIFVPLSDVELSLPTHTEIKMKKKERRQVAGHI